MGGWRVVKLPWNVEFFYGWKCKKLIVTVCTKTPKLLFSIYCCCVEIRWTYWYRFRTKLFQGAWTCGHCPISLKTVALFCDEVTVFVLHYILEQRYPNFFVRAITQGHISYYTAVRGPDILRIVRMASRGGFVDSGWTSDVVTVCMGVWRGGQGPPGF